MARPRPNPAGPETGPTHTHPLSARANGCVRTRIPIEEGAEELRRARLWRFIPNVRRRVMTMETVALSSLEPGRGNPRKKMDRNGIEGGLAASIRNDG